MRIRGNYATYLYAVEGFKQYNNGFKEKDQNPDLIAMEFGGGKMPYVFHKENAYDLMLTIYGKKQLVDYLGITREKFDEYVEENGLLNVMTANLKGRGFVMVTDFANYAEYSNGGQNGIIGITAMDIDGELYAEKGEKLFTDKAKYEEMYNYKKPETL